MKCIDDEIPFEIPEGWEWCRLGFLSEIIGGYAFESSSLKASFGDRVIRISDIDETGFVNNKIVRYNGTAISEAYRIKKLDILLAMTGGTVGKSLYVKTLPEDSLLLNQRVAIIRNRFIDSDYLDLVIKSPHIKDVINIRKNSTNDNISMTDIYNFLIPIPAVRHQTVIVKAFSDILPLIDRYGVAKFSLDRLNTNIKATIQKSVLQEAIQGKLVPQDPADEPASVLLDRIREEKQRLLKEGKLKKKDITDSIIFKGDDNKYYERIDGNLLDISDEVPFDLPDSWVWTRLSSVCNMFTGNSISEKDKSTYFTGVSGMQYIGTKDVRFDNSIDYKNGIAIPDIFLPNFKIAPSGSVLMCIEGGSAGRKVGQTDRDVCFGNKLCCFSSFGGYQRYLYYYIQSPSFVESFQKNKTGIIGGVSVNSLKNLLIAIPPIKEQVRIAQHVAEILSFL